MDDSTPGDDTGTRRDSLDNVFACLGNRERRRILDLAIERAPDPVARTELATALAADADGTAREDVSDAGRERAAVRLHHEHLPALTGTDLLEWDRDDDTVALTVHPVYDDRGLRQLIQNDGPGDPESLDGLCRALADGRRRTILDVLSHQFGRIHVETLARELVAGDRDVAESDVPVDDVDRELGHLRNVDLPHLAEAALVEYDAEKGTVAYEGHPQLRVAWMHSVLQPELRQTLTGEADPGGIGEIEGREQVISFGQSLCGRADEELFCMFTDTKLLEAGCLTRIRDTARNGVDVYLGTRDQDVRDYVTEHAPEVILWEPNTDWLNLPVAGDRVGRLLLADRDAVMLGTLLEETEGSLHEEQAIVGEGEHNTLVTMICQLLAPHLEEIDRETEDVEARIPL